jgi:hypothetical protein
MQRSHRHRCDCGDVSKELKIYVGCIDRAMLVLGRLDKVQFLTHRDEVEKQDWIVMRCLTYFILTPVCYMYSYQEEDERSANVGGRDG